MLCVCVCVFPDRRFPLRSPAARCCPSGLMPSTLIPAFPSAPAASPRSPSACRCWLWPPTYTILSRSLKNERYSIKTQIDLRDTKDISCDTGNRMNLMLHRITTTQIPLQTYEPFPSPVLTKRATLMVISVGDADSQTSCSHFSYIAVQVSGAGGQVGVPESDGVVWGTGEERGRWQAGLGGIWLLRIDLEKQNVLRWRAEFCFFHHEFFSENGKYSRQTLYQQ